VERTYSTVDKGGWGDGPWRDEPDNDECGLRDPQAPPDTGPSRGLWQFAPSRHAYPSRQRWDDWFDY
jgi:hypothetical protein